MAKLNHKTLPQEVSNQILSRIAGGEFPPGANLPNEYEIAEQFGVSRIVIREATRLLSSKGILDSRQGRGTFVMPVDTWNQLDPQILMALLTAGRLGDLSQDLVEVRKMLEVEAAGLAAVKASGEQVKALGVLLEQMKEGEDGDLPKFVDLEHQFHIQIWHSTGNKLLAYMLESLSEVFRLVKDMVYRKNWLDVNRDHILVFEAIERGDVQGARTAMSNDISRFEDEIRQALESGPNDGR